MAEALASSLLVYSLVGSEGALSLPRTIRAAQSHSARHGRSLMLSCGYVEEEDCERREAGQRRAAKSVSAVREAETSEEGLEAGLTPIRKLKSERRRSTCSQG